MYDVCTCAYVYVYTKYEYIKRVMSFCLCLLVVMFLSVLQIKSVTNIFFISVMISVATTNVTSVSG